MIAHRPWEKIRYVCGGKGKQQKHTGNITRCILLAKNCTGQNASDSGTCYPEHRRYSTFTMREYVVGHLSRSDEMSCKALKGRGGTYPSQNRRNTRLGATGYEEGASIACRGGNHERGHTAPDKCKGGLNENDMAVTSYRQHIRKWQT